jgi:hypothetical protein
MMHRSIQYTPVHLQSSANALWETPLSPCLPPDELLRSSTKPSICVDRLLLHLRRDHRQFLDESVERKKRPTSQRKTLIDDTKIDRLLQLLRTNKFVGTIDPEHHAHYLSEELLQESAKKCTMTRRSFAHVSTKRESSHFKTALQKSKSSQF